MLQITTVHSISHHHTKSFLSTVISISVLAYPIPIQQVEGNDISLMCILLNGLICFWEKKTHAHGPKGTVAHSYTWAICNSLSFTSMKLQVQNYVDKMYKTHMHILYIYIYIIYIYEVCMYKCFGPIYFSLGLKNKWAHIQRSSYRLINKHTWINLKPDMERNTDCNA